MTKFLEAIINTGIDYGSKHTTRLFAEKYGKKYVSKYIFSVFVKWAVSILLNIMGIVILVFKPWNQKINDFVGSSFFLIAFIIPIIRLIIWAVKKSKRTINTVRSIYYADVILKYKLKSHRTIRTILQKFSLSDILISFLSVIWIEILVFIIVCIFYFIFMWLVKPYLVNEFVDLSMREIILFPLVFLYKQIKFYIF